MTVDRDTGQGHPCLKKTGKEDTTATQVREPFTYFQSPFQPRPPFTYFQSPFPTTTYLWYI
jgi:hypothetical protein